MARRVTRRLAVVTPWFGRDLRGGAERQSRQVALRLAARGHAVEVLATCSRDFSSDWSANHHAPGARREDGLNVRRFPADARDAAAFDRANASLLARRGRDLKRGLCPVAHADARAFVEHNINSSALVSFLRARAADYDAFIFIPYLYGTTLRGLPAVAPRALLQPCLHDEAYARLPAVAETFRRARLLLFNSEGERQLAHALYGPGIHTRARVVGEGVELFTVSHAQSHHAPTPRRDETRHDEPQDDELQDDELQDDKFQDDELRDDEIQDDELRDDELQHDRLQGGEIQNDEFQGDGLQRERASGGDVSLPVALRGAGFVLYLGRRDRTKNTHLLLAAFRRFRRRHPASDLKLVLAGEGQVEHVGPDALDALSDPCVVDLGFVGESSKAALLGAARALFQPSRNESFSRALMEAWLSGRPAAAHRDCLATARAVESCGGGWLASSADEWAELFARVAHADERQLDELGARGRAYAREHADWDKVIDRYEAAFAELQAGAGGRGPGAGEEGERGRGKGQRKEQASPEGAEEGTEEGTEEGAEEGAGFVAASPSPLTFPPSPPLPGPRPPAPGPRSPLPSVHQLLPDFVYGDAISNQAVALRERLRARGYESEIFALRREARVASEARAVGEFGFGPESGLIYHHSIGSEVTAAAVAHRGPKCLVYHNVTPPEFFAAHRPGFAWLLETGRASLRRLAREFPCSAGDSPFNAAELAAAGFDSPGVLPIIVNPDRWNVAPDESLLRRLQDGRTNLLFVGRVAPNKRQDRLVGVFAEYARADADSRLVLAGEGESFDPYFARLAGEARRLCVEDRLLVTGRLDDAQLLACYLSADVFLSASEHEGFGVPLVEAMWFDVPVLAARAAAVPDTVAEAALLFDPAADLREVARLAKLLARDDTGLRRRLVEAGRRRREDFTPESVAPALDALVARMAARAGREVVGL
jgi:glycosyltransferase involved in cell wall biosynthesis